MNLGLACRQVNAWCMVDIEQCPLWHTTRRPRWSLDIGELLGLIPLCKHSRSWKNEGTGVWSSCGLCLKRTVSFRSFPLPEQNITSKRPGGVAQESHPVKALETTPSSTRAADSRSSETCASRPGVPGGLGNRSFHPGDPCDSFWRFLGRRLQSWRIRACLKRRKRRGGEETQC